MTGALALGESENLLRPIRILRVERFLGARRSFRMCSRPIRCGGKYTLLFRVGGSDSVGALFFGVYMVLQEAWVGVRVPG